MELSRTREFITMMYHFPAVILFALDNVEALDRTMNTPNKPYGIYKMLLN